MGVVILDPGISSVEDEEQVYPEVRRAEATFMATELADVLTEQGGWGAVRVVPDERQFSDLLVRGTILQSDGEALELKIRVSDARGTVWLDKRYTGITSRYAYEQGTRTKQDPFLSVYRMIANDMLAVSTTACRRAHHHSARRRDAICAGFRQWRLCRLSQRRSLWAGDLAQVAIGRGPHAGARARFAATTLRVCRYASGPLHGLF